MFKQDYREYFSSEVNILHTQVKKFRSSKLYKDLLSLFVVLLNTSCRPDIFYKKFLILNTRLGILADLLKERKKDFRLVSPTVEEYYFTPIDYRPKFKWVNWKKISINLFYRADCLLDFNLSFDTLDQLDLFITFLNKNYNPKLLLLVDTEIDHNLMIEKFESCRYENDEKARIKSINLLKNKISTFDINNIYIFNYIPEPIIKEDIGLICQEQ